MTTASHLVIYSLAVPKQLLWVGIVQLQSPHAHNNAFSFVPWQIVIKLTNLVMYAALS